MQMQAITLTAMAARAYLKREGCNFFFFFLQDCTELVGVFRTNLQNETIFSRPRPTY